MHADDPTPIESAPSTEAVRRGQVRALEQQLALRAVYSQQLASENLRLRDLLLAHGISPDAGLVRAQVGGPTPEMLERAVAIPKTPPRSERNG